MQQQDLKAKFKMAGLNKKEFWKWPLVVKGMVGAIFGVTVFVVGVITIVVPEYTSYQNEVTKEEKLKKDFTDKAKQSVNLNLYKDQLIEITSASDALLKQLPNRSEVEKLIIDINQSGIGRGLRFELFKPEVEKIGDFYAELPIKLEVTGNYSSIGNFASDLSQLSRVVILNDLLIVNKQNGDLKMTATAKTFRYLDQDEIERKKAEARSKANPKSRARAKK